ncbi:MAG TPA: transcription antitermination factor NusB [Armatimonadota bacterium]|jgi:N utilization substance protein B
MNRKQRHLGRELALSWLYQIDVAATPPEEALAEIPDDIEGVEDEGADFARQLVRGVLADQARLDAGIAKYARGWSLSRMAAVERNVLRLALYEILDVPDIPTSVSVDEAVEVAKRYGAEESGKFVNGILGAFIRGELQPPATA